MLAAYERRLVLFYLSNTASRLHCRSEGARKLVQWLGENEEELELQHPLTRRGKSAEEQAGQRGHDQTISPREWRRLGEILRSEFVAARQTRSDQTARRLRRLAKAMQFTRTDMAILELLLRHETNSFVESMIDDIFENTVPGHATRFTSRGFLLCSWAFRPRCLQTARRQGAASGVRARVH